ncbi:MAG: tetratricopeptide repeat protein [Bradyrhizobiaceae bacterium]|nr:MAG: tetratricopeptide repeat protein [Bradyrhizobiaceae bacterium]
MSEIFSEIDEDLRREQVQKFLKRYSGLIFAVALVIVAGVGGWRFYQLSQEKKAAESSAAFEAAITLAGQNKSADAEGAFNKIVADGTKGYQALSRLRAAAEAAKRDPKAAVLLYDGIAADGALGPAEQDIARIRAAGVLLDTAPYAEIRQRLEPLAAPGRAFRHTARELLSLSAWRNSDASATRQWLDMISKDPESPSAIRSRAEALQALLPPAAKS